VPLFHPRCLEQAAECLAALFHDLLVVENEYGSCKRRDKIHPPALAADVPVILDDAQPALTEGRVDRPNSVARDRLVEHGLVGIDEVLEFLLIVILSKELPELAAHPVGRCATQQAHAAIPLVQNLEGVMPRVIDHMEQRVVEQHIHGDTSVDF
jgi:hypothetical protein